MKRLPPTPYAGRPDPRRRETLWARVDRNRLLLVGYLMLFAIVGALWFAMQAALTLLALFFVLAFIEQFDAITFVWGLLGGGLEPAGWRLLFVGVLVTIAYEVHALSRSERRIVRRFSATLVPKGDLWDTKMLLKDMAIAAGLDPAPALFVLEARGTNAFVVRAIGRRPILGVTHKFLERLAPAEQRAVFANLVARIVSGDTLLATAITGLLAPLEEWRDRRLTAANDDTLKRIGERPLVPLGDEGRLGRPVTAAESGFVYLFFFSAAFVLMGEIAAAIHRRSQRRAAEKADAEGMLLLKDPASMLSALERCVYLDNVVSKAGPAYGQLFYCWPGDSTNDEDDPEWERVARLREVLGVDGMVDEGPLGPSGEPYYPPAPRMEGEA